MSGRVALTTGITGQDGAYLAEYLISPGYVVHGIKRRSSSFNTARVESPIRGETFVTRKITRAVARIEFGIEDALYLGNLEAKLSFKEVEREIAWRGKGVDEIGIDRSSGKTVVRIDPTYFPPIEVDILVGDASKENRMLDWKQPKRTFGQLVDEMVASDLKYARRESSSGSRSI